MGRIEVEQLTKDKVRGARTRKGLQCECHKRRAAVQVLAFLPAVLLFYVSLFSNNKMLQYANVDTFIVFRSTTPILVLPLEVAALKKPMPPLRAILCLCMIALG
eukprot:scaffold8103_cov403-Prasinococcus_capsulatus_cf.AAC.5